MWRRPMRAAHAFVVVCATAAATPVFAGPPFVTDDPEPVEYRHFEFIPALEGQHRHGEQSGALPSAELNYGLLPDLQVGVKAAMAFDHQAGDGLHYGFGDTELGIKYRFMSEDEAGWRPQASFAPSVTLASGDARRGLGDGHKRFVLPLWLEKSFGEWTTYGGGGYVLHKHGADKNFWIAGWALLRKVSDKLQVGGELFYNGAVSTTEPSSVGMNIGAVYDVAKNMSILAAAGRGITHARETNVLSYFLGLQTRF
ncbi:hypothetical protein OKW29_000363 [Paraburkholderia sp. CI3]